MAELLKNLYNEEMVTELCFHIKQQYPTFKTAAYKKIIFDSHWEEKELKQRMRHISQSLHDFLPKDYKETMKVLKPAAKHSRGFEYMLFPDYVELFGQDYYAESIKALQYFTLYSTSELAVRPFIARYGDKMMSQMERWAEHSNHHVRRLASEGCRPRLPWAMALPEFKKDPSPVIRVIEKLMRDESEYVRRSVANNINDISKDHPDIALQFAKQWKGDNENTDKLLKHACRTLLKQSNTKALSLFGYGHVNRTHLANFNCSRKVKMGEELDFSFEIETDKKHLGKLRIEYAIGFVRAHGKMNYKVFMLSEGQFKGDKKSLSKKHSFRAITTRRYYKGEHHLMILLNGREKLRVAFELT